MTPCDQHYCARNRLPPERCSGTRASRIPVYRQGPPSHPPLSMSQRELWVSPQCLVVWCHSVRHQLTCGVLAALPPLTHKCRTCQKSQSRSRDSTRALEGLVDEISVSLQRWRLGKGITHHKEALKRIQLCVSCGQNWWSVHSEGSFSSDLQVLLPCLFLIAATLPGIPCRTSSLYSHARPSASTNLAVRQHKPGPEAAPSWSLQALPGFLKS